MKKPLTTLFTLLCVAGFGQSLQWRNPTTTQFGSNNYVLTLKSGVVLTNPVVNSGTITGDGNGLTNLNLVGTNFFHNSFNEGVDQYAADGEFHIVGNIYTDNGFFEGNGGALTNLNASNLASGKVPVSVMTNTAVSGLTLYGTTTNAAGSGSNWIGGISLWNPATGKTVSLTNGSVSTTAGITETQNGVSTTISSNRIYFGAGSLIGTLNSTIDTTTIEDISGGRYQLSYYNGLRITTNLFIGFSPGTAVSANGQWAYFENAGVAGQLIANTNLIAKGTVTATNGVFGASGTLSVTTQIVVSVVSGTYTNILFGTANYTKVFGGITASTDGALTNAVAGNYLIQIGTSFSGAGGTTLYEGAVFTNNVECTIVEWERDVSSATTGNANAMSIVTLPANCRVDFRVKNGGSESATFKRAYLNLLGAN